MCRLQCSDVINQFEFVMLQRTLAKRWHDGKVLFAHTPFDGFQQIAKLVVSQCLAHMEMKRLVKIITVIRWRPFAYLLPDHLFSILLLPLKILTFSIQFDDPGHTALLTQLIHTDSQELFKMQTLVMPMPLQSGVVTHGAHA